VYNESEIPFYNWPLNTAASITSRFDPERIVAKDWNNYFVNYNHGYVYDGTQFDKIGPEPIWFSAGHYEPDNDRLICGNSGFAGLYTATGWAGQKELGNQLDITSTDQIQQADRTTNFYAARCGKIVNDGYERYKWKDIYVTPHANPPCITVTWTPCGDYIDEIGYYYLYRSTSRYGPASLVTKPVPKENIGMVAYSYNDVTAVKDITYHYWLAPELRNGDTIWCYLGNARPIDGQSMPQPPAVPHGIAIAPDGGGKALTLNWQGDPGSMYYIGRYADNNPDNIVPIAYTTNNTYTDNSVQNGKAYTYVLQAAGAEKQVSASSVPASGTPADNKVDPIVKTPKGVIDVTVQAAC